MKKTFLTALCTLVLMGAAPATLWNGNSGGFQLTWSEADLRIKSAQTQFSLFPPTPALDPDPEIRCEYEWGLKPLSWVGPYLSYRQESYWGCMKTAHPGMQTEFLVKDLRAPQKPLALNQLFPDAQILKALLADSLVRQALAKAPKRTYQTTAELLAALNELNGECEYYFGQDMLTHFAFHHVQGQQVAVRLGLSHGCEAARGNLTQLGLLLPIPQALKAPLQAAAQGKAGFLMGAMETRFKDRKSLRKYVDPGMKYPPY